MAIVGFREEISRITEVDTFKDLTGSFE